MNRRFSIPLALAIAVSAGATQGAPAEQAGKAVEPARQVPAEKAKAQAMAEERPKDGEQVRESAKARVEQAEGKGAQQSPEMQDRREERKQIQEDSRATAEGDGSRAGKKPWWKFWADE